jgi:Common central domain of tyrosinase
MDLDAESIHSNTVHQMHSNPRFLPWHRFYLLNCVHSVLEGATMCNMRVTPSVA